MGSMCCSNRFEDAEENAEVLSKKRTVTRRPPPLENISESESVEFPLDPMQSAESSEINNSRIKYPQVIEIDKLDMTDCSKIRITPKFNDEDARFLFKSNRSETMKKKIKASIKRDKSAPILLNRTYTNCNLNQDNLSKQDELIDDFKKTLSTHKKQKKKKINGYIKEREERFMSPSQIWENVDRLGGLENVEYGTIRESFIVLRSSSSEEF